MDARDRILQAAAHVYAESGFRGATTRRIASEAGVNEVTLFRIFGSKSALLDEILQARASHVPVADLPETPVDPLRELTRWCTAHLDHLRTSRSLIRKMMSELEERPEIAPCAGSGPTWAARALRGYLDALRRAGIARAGGDPTAPVAMLLGTLFADAMGRDVWPNVFPQPADAAPRRYARLFLRAVGAAVGRPERRATDENGSKKESKVQSQKQLDGRSNGKPGKARQTVASRQPDSTATRRRSAGRR